MKFLGAISAVAMMAGTALTSTPALAVDFSDKTITAIVPFKEGGGSDRMARLWGPFYAKYLPGKPKIIVRNMPGGGSIRGNNWFHANGKPDGTMVSLVSTSSQTGQVLGGSKVKYNLLEWNMVVLEPVGTIFYTHPKLGLKGKSIGDAVKTMRKTDLVFGAKNPTAAELRGFMAYELLGIDTVKAVFGLSTGGQRKALLRGETNINYDSAQAFLKNVTKYVESETVIPLMTLGLWKDGKFERDPGYPNLPTVVDAYKAVNGGKEPSGIVYEAFKNFFHMGVTASKAIALPPKTPQAIVDAWVAATKKIMVDPDFVKKAGSLHHAYQKVYGKDATDVIRAAIDMKPEVRAFMEKFLKKKFDVNI
jgi:tripartite-type tricarboxylate transporter receptor subunit TctC